MIHEGVVTLAAGRFTATIDGYGLPRHPDGSAPMVNARFNTREEAENALPSLRKTFDRLYGQLISERT